MKKKSIRTEKYKKGVYVLKNTVIDWLRHASLNPEMIQGTRYDDDSESFIIKISLTSDEVQKVIINTE
jgi:hypothetical protein